MVDPLVYFSFQPVLHDCGMFYPVCGMVHIKEPLLLIGSSPCGSSGFLLSLFKWSYTICLMQYNHKVIALSNNAGIFILINVWWGGGGGIRKTCLLLGSWVWFYFLCHHLLTDYKAFLISVIRLLDDDGFFIYGDVTTASYI